MGGLVTFILSSLGNRWGFGGLFRPSWKKRDILEGNNCVEGEGCLVTLLESVVKLRIHLVLPGLQPAEQAFRGAIYDRSRSAAIL